MDPLRENLYIADVDQAGKHGFYQMALYFSYHR
ncbi:hypothetical protein SAMN06264855_10671 [Halorubrum vacuolatum]|uniref:Uncharacterized protein n=1 Tax=Halorubrum vacuolatum TaxID=63740 RepID=A0A238W9B3_HALVU|nr:hypothetical protein SAMN06264855_10671 [Halorubrum vacuolatum]